MRSTLDPTLDIIFKMLFARDEAQLIALLTAVLRPARPIAKVQVRNPEVAPDQANDKNIVLDILVELEDGTLLDVEMQACIIGPRCTAPSWPGARVMPRFAR